MFNNGIVFQRSLQGRNGDSSSHPVYAGWFIDSEQGKCAQLGCSERVPAGVGGFGAVTARYPHVIDIAKIAGVIFLLGYGLQSLHASVRVSHALTVEGQVVTSLKKALLLCFGFTWLNPHVYLDTLVLVGMVSTGASSKLTFAAGAISASFFFFFALGYGARLLRPLFEKPKAWNILDALVGLLMLYLAWHLYQG